MKYSVSATCLSTEVFEDNVLAMLDYTVDDLHCDFFPEIASAPGLSLDQIEWCVKNWPRGLTIHLWGRAGLEMLTPSLHSGQLIIQLHDSSDTQLQILSNAMRDGWRTGVSLLPDLVPEVMERTEIPLAAIQVLSTTTPGFPGGSFDASTWKALRYLQDRRVDSGGEWTIVVDGGLNPAIMAALPEHCDLAVIGTNYLRRHPVTEHWVPDLLLEPTCLNNTST